MESVNVYDLFRGKIYLGPDLVNLNYGLLGYYSGVRGGRVIIDLSYTYSRLRIASSNIVDFSFKLRGTVSFVTLLKYSLLVTRGKDTVLGKYCLFFGTYIGYGRLTVLPYRTGILTNFRYVFGNLFDNFKNKKFRKEYLRYFPQFVVALSDKYNYSKLANECNKLGLPALAFSDTASLGSEIPSFFIPGNMSYSSNNLLVRVVLNSFKQSYVMRLMIFSKKIKKFGNKIFSKKNTINCFFCLKLKHLLLVFEIINNIVQNYWLNFFHQIKKFNFSSFKCSYLNYKKKKLLVRSKFALRLNLNLSGFRSLVFSYKFKFALNLFIKFLFSNFLTFIFCTVKLTSSFGFLENLKPSLTLNKFYRLPFFMFYVLFYNKSFVYKFVF